MITFTLLKIQTWIRAPDLLCIFLIVSPPLPIIKATYDNNECKHDTVTLALASSNKKNIQQIYLIIGNFHDKLFCSRLDWVESLICRGRSRAPCICLYNKNIFRVVLFESWNSKNINAQTNINIAFTSAMTSLISCSALLICSDVPVKSTSLVRELRSASESLVIWILAPDWSCSCFIVSPPFPIITPTWKTELPKQIQFHQHYAMKKVRGAARNQQSTFPFGIVIFLLVPGEP